MIKQCVAIIYNICNMWMKCILLLGKKYACMLGVFDSMDLDSDSVNVLGMRTCKRLHNLPPWLGGLMRSLSRSAVGLAG